MPSCVPPSKIKESGSIVPSSPISSLIPQLQQKAIASEIFKGKKDNYPQSVPRLFISTRLGEPLLFLCPSPLSSSLSLSNIFVRSHIWVTGADEISPKVLQVLGSEPIQVRTAYRPWRTSFQFHCPMDGWGQGMGVTLQPLTQPAVSSMQCQSSSMTARATSPVPASCC